MIGPVDRDRNRGVFDNAFKQAPGDRERSAEIVGVSNGDRMKKMGHAHAYGTVCMYIDVDQFGGDPTGNAFENVNYCHYYFKRRAHS